MTTPLEPPAALAAAEMTLNPIDAQGQVRSPFTLRSQTFDWQNQLWRAEVRFARRNDARAAELRGFLFKLRGTVESFYLGDPSAANPQGTQTADFILDQAASQGDAVLNVAMGAGATLKAGDYVQLGIRLYVLTDDATADGGGLAALNIWPYVREDQASSSVVKSTNARGAWRLDEPNWKYAVERPRFFAPQRLKLVEAL